MTSTVVVFMFVVVGSTTAQMSSSHLPARRRAFDTARMLTLTECSACPPATQTCTRVVDDDYTLCECRLDCAKQITIMLCDVTSCASGSQCFTNGFVIECARFMDRDRIVPCVANLCAGAGVSGKCFLMYGVPKCCSRDAAVCHDSYSGKSKGVELNGRDVAMQGVGTQVIVDHQRAHALNHGLDPSGGESYDPTLRRFDDNEGQMMSTTSFGVVIFATLFFIVSMVLLICGASSFSCYSASSGRGEYDRWKEQRTTPPSGEICEAALPLGEYVVNDDRAPMNKQRLSTSMLTTDTQLTPSPKPRCEMGIGGTTMVEMHHVRIPIGSQHRYHNVYHGGISSTSVT